jgi:acetolactate synthase-1/2/3 large subunit
MAEAQGKLSGRPGVCFVTRGPGATNASIGVHTAFQDSTPLVLFVGQVASDQRDREAFQELDYRQSSSAPARWAWPSGWSEVHDADRMPEYVARAFPHRDAGPPRPGGAGAARGHADADGGRAVLPRVEAVQAWPRPAACATCAACCWPRNGRSSLPAAAAGTPKLPRRCSALPRTGNCRWAAFRFQDTFDNRHPLYAGDVGIGINPKLAAAHPRADLVIAIGPRLGEMTTGGYTLLTPRPKQKLVHIHAGAEELGRVYAGRPAAAGHDECAAKALEVLTAPPTCPGATWTAAAHADYRGQPRSAPGEPWTWRWWSRPSPATCLPENTVYTNGAGNFAGWMHRLSRTGACSQGPHAAGAHLGRHGLRRAGRAWVRPCCTRSARWSTSPATATS